MSKFHTAKQIGTSMGLSIKALRLYEARGLIAPGRTAAGWRIYGPDDIDRLHRIQAFKSLGFSLADIADLLARDVATDDVLAAQETALADQQVRLARALRVIRKARAKLARNRPLSSDELVQLTEETRKMSDFEWTKAHDDLAAKHFTPEQMKDLEARKLSPEFQAQVSAEWEQILADAERLMDGPPDSPEAIDLTRRWMKATELFTKGDPALHNATANWYQEGYSSPDTEGLMPFPKKMWDFVAAAAKHLPSEDT